MSGYWDDIENDVLGCLAGRRSMTPAEIAHRLALSQDAVVSLLAMLAHEGKVRIRLVEGIEQRAIAA